MFDAYPVFVFIHILLFVAWLGGDIGVFILGQHFRRRAYSLETRLVLLRLLVLNDMAPRTAWALMVPVTITMLALGNWAAIPGWAVALSWLTGTVWLLLVWGAYLNDQTPLATRLRRLELALKCLLTLVYLAIGMAALAGLEGLGLPGWLTAKALLFAVIFAAAIMIDMAYKPVGPLLMQLIEKGSGDATEEPLLRAMNRTRVWVLMLYGLLVVTAALGTLKPGFALPGI